MSQSGKIRVGLVGASANPLQWGAAAHVPALRSLPEFELAAVAATRQETADAGAAAHGIPLAFGNYHDMIARPDIDLVCVVTSVLHHHDLTMAALDAGKAVMCEWPLGITTREAIDMRDKAKGLGRGSLIGLQGSLSPEVRYAADLIAQGYVGDVMSVNMIRASAQLAVPALPESMLYFLDRKQANAGLMILAAHALDTLAACVGEFADLQAYTETLQKTIIVAETGEPYQITAADHILVQGRLNNGAAVSAHVKMNSPVATELRIEISGTRGAVILTSEPGEDPNVRQPGIPNVLKLWGAPSVGAPFEALPVPASYLSLTGAPGGAAYNVTQLYRGYSSGWDNFATPLDFSHAVRRHLLLDAIQSAADEGKRVIFDPHRA